jgi:hypothetical protein
MTTSTPETVVPSRLGAIMTEQPDINLVDALAQMADEYDVEASIRQTFSEETIGQSIDTRLVRNLLENTTWRPSRIVKRFPFLAGVFESAPTFAAALEDGGHVKRGTESTPRWYPSFTMATRAVLQGFDPAETNFANAKRIGCHHRSVARVRKELTA